MIDPGLLKKVLWIKKFLNKSFNDSVDINGEECLHFPTFRKSEITVSQDEDLLSYLSEKIETLRREPPLVPAPNLPGHVHLC